MSNYKVTIEAHFILFSKAHMKHLTLYPVLMAALWQAWVFLKLNPSWEGSHEVAFFEAHKFFRNRTGEICIFYAFYSSSHLRCILEVMSDGSHGGQEGQLCLECVW